MNFEISLVLLDQIESIPNQIALNIISDSFEEVSQSLEFWKLEKSSEIDLLAQQVVGNPNNKHLWHVTNAIDFDIAEFTTSIELQVRRLRCNNLT